MSIKIFTEFHASTTTAINAGEIQQVKEFKPTPRNLISAYKFLTEHRGAMTKSWGNEGHIKSWISIDDNAIDDDDYDLFMLDADTPKDILDGKTRTELAEKILTQVSN